MHVICLRTMGKNTLHLFDGKASVHLLHAFLFLRGMYYLSTFEFYLTSQSEPIDKFKNFSI